MPRSTFYPVEKYVRPVINANVSIKGSSMILLIGRSSCTLLRACLQLLPASVNPRLTASNRGLDVTLVSVTAACTNIQPSTVSWPNPSSVHVHSVGIMRARVDVCIRCASSVYVCINCACVGHHACMCMCAYHRSRSRLQDATFPLHLGLRCPNPRPHHLRGYVCGVCVYCTCIFCA